MTDPDDQKLNDFVESGFKIIDLGEDTKNMISQTSDLIERVASLEKDIPGPGSVIGPEPERVVHNQHRGDVIGAKLWVEQEAQVYPGRYVLLISELEERMRMVYTPEAGWSDVHRAGTEGAQK